MVGWHHRLNGHGLGRLRQFVIDREAWRAEVHGSQRVRHDCTTELILILKTKSGRNLRKFHYFGIFWKSNIPVHRNGIECAIVSAIKVHTGCQDSALISIEPYWVKIFISTKERL